MLSGTQARRKQNSILKKSKPPPPAVRAGNAAGRKEMKKSSMTRQRILDAAAAIFAHKGYGRTLMSEIAEEADIHITALYYHFNTKDDLAAGVINHVASLNHHDIVEAVKALPRDVEFAQKLRAAIHAQLEGIVARRDYVRAQLKILSELPEDYQEIHRALLHESAAFWRRLLSEGWKSGLMRRDLDPSIARMILHGSINWTIEWYRPGGRSAAEIADQIADIMLNGMYSRPR
jgi:AcrR family transcriptional regulator